MVYVSHSVEEVVRLAQHVVLLSGGSVAASGNVREVMGHPEIASGHLFEGGAVIDGEVVAHDLQYGLATVTFDGGTFTVPNLDALIGEPVRLRIRARDVSIALTRPADISVQNVLKGTVSEIGPAAGAVVVVSIAVGALSVRSRITRRAAEHLGLKPGIEVYALIKAVSLDRHGVGYAG
jgi:molybdate transport system ATP-binding protein